MTEETHNAAMAGPIGIVMAIGVSAVLGWFLILGLLFSIQDLDRTVNTTTGEPVAQIFLDTVGEKGAIALSHPVNRGRKLHRCHAALTLSQRLFKKKVPLFTELSPSNLLVSHCLPAYINPSQGCCHLRSR